MKSLGIFTAPGKPQAHRLALELADLASRYGLEVRLQEEYSPTAELGGDGCPISDEIASCDVLVTLSGDGGVLAAARAAAKFRTPVLAVDLGRLGFLSAVRPENLERSFHRLIDGEFQIEERMMIEAEVFRCEKNPSDGAGESVSVGGGIALNDAVVAKSALARILRLSIYARGELIAAIRADGLVVSTPTGSTAYALSAGGPIVPPDVPLLLVCPICAHTLNQRPFIVGADETLEVRAEWAGDEVKSDSLDAMLTLDGQVGVILHRGDLVRVRRAAQTARLLRDPEDTFYGRLRHKMGWSG
ncbi:NAD+ kinase [Abditibacterium utsteinense]|uniref:NAD kinase n=1 Tax=Abditibacterium utsteinense TaxID=1960156 RepID=A0A2S8SRH2_9BACT|nr:NAD(+)/NADH kinase [Abditibacterium utsteinense]PQV63376.1 NAD+ kinase [Abditibacterium utsteinense]